MFEIAITGALADVEGDEALLVREVGDPLRFAKLAAWDERGHSLPAWMEDSDAGLRLVVDDSGAIGVVTVDPLLTTAAWTAESDQADANFGYSVAAAGVVNGDGFGDVVVGAVAYNNGSADEGRAYVRLSHPDPVVLTRNPVMVSSPLQGFHTARGRPVCGKSTSAIG